MPSTPDATTNGGRQVFRQRSALLAGGFLLALLAAIAVLTALDGTAGLLPTVLWCLAIGLVVWVVLLRPSVRLTTSGVELRNVVRDVRLPWPQVDVVESRWNLKIYTPEDHGYSAWAISAQRPPRRGGGFGVTPGAGSSAPEPHREASAGGVADLVRRTREEYDVAVRGADVPPQTGPVVVRPAVPALVALALAVALVVVALAV